jgi:hypothetical protein
VMVIVTMLSSMALVAMWSAQEEARIQRTRAQIAKIHEILLDNFEAYPSRPVRLAANLPPGERRRERLLVLRDMMRMEFPDRQSDLLTDPLFPALPKPPLRRALERRLASLGGTWTRQHEQAECLYLILSCLRFEDRDALSYFRDSEIGNVDGDAVPEILDAWGNPIAFLRWAPGFSEHPGPNGAWGVNGVDDDGDGITDNYTEAGWRSIPPQPGEDDFLSPSFIQTRNAQRSPDPFDPLKVDPRWSDGDETFAPFLLFPLVFSAGSSALVLPNDEVDYGLVLGSSSGTFTYAEPGFVGNATEWYRAMDPFKPNDEGNLIGTPRWFTMGERVFENLITNHDVESP